MADDPQIHRALLGEAPIGDERGTVRGSRSPEEIVERLAVHVWAHRRLPLDKPANCEMVARDLLAALTAPDLEALIEQKKGTQDG